MFTKAEDVFIFKLNALIELEKTRMTKQAEKYEQLKQAAIEKALRDQQAEADRLAKIDAEKQQFEAIRIAKEKALTEQTTIPAESLRAEAKRRHETAAHADRNEDARREHEQARELERQADALEKTERYVTYTLVFRAKVKSTTSNEQFKAMIDKEVTLSDRAKKAIVSAVVEWGLLLLQTEKPILVASTDDSKFPRL